MTDSELGKLSVLELRIKLQSLLTRRSSSPPNVYLDIEIENLHAYIKRRVELENR